MNNGEGGFFGQLFRQRIVVEESLGALSGADLPDAGDIQPSPVHILLRRLPAETTQVYVQGEETAVNPRVGPDLLQLTPALHEGQAISCTAHLETKVTQNVSSTSAVCRLLLFLKNIQYIYI